MLAGIDDRNCRICAILYIEYESQGRIGMWPKGRFLKRRWAVIGSLDVVVEMP
jgi:hypothetical protein